MKEIKYFPEGQISVFMKDYNKIQSHKYKWKPEKCKKPSGILLDYEEKSQTLIFQTGGNDRRVT